MHIRSLILLLSTLFALSACSMSDDTALAENEVPRFHEALDSSQFEFLYNNGSENLKKAATMKEFVSLLEAVYRKLGNVSSSNKKTWNVNYHTSGTFVTLTYDTVFTQGKGTEQFVYKLSGKEAQLVGYHINSNDLISR